MNTQVLTFSADVPSLRNNQLFSEAITLNYPGSSWAGYVKKKCPWPVDFQTIDVTLDKIREGVLDPKCVALVQHHFDDQSTSLIRMGAVPLLLVMHESPLYAGKFYDCLNDLAKKFKNVMIFGAKDSGISNATQAYFPSYSKLDIHNNQTPWSMRQFACMVVSNKYVLTKPIFFSENIQEFFWWAGKFVRRRMGNLSLSKQINLDLFQLQDKRLEIIEVMLSLNLLDLYGSGWEKLFRIPPSIRKKLSLLIPGGGVATIPYGKDTKRHTLSKYKFNICFENMSYPGYVTEKIIDAILAGTIPVYWGAPDISDYVPEDVFIDASRFSDFEEMVNHLLNMDEQCAERMLQKGREFLVSPAGQRFSYESIASEVIEMLRPYVR
jgi:hypothetical protein